MKTNIIKDNRKIEVGDLVDFDGDGNYNIIIKTINEDYALMDTTTGCVTTIGFAYLKNLINKHNLKLVAKADELELRLITNNKVE